MPALPPQILVGLRRATYTECPLFKQTSLLESQPRKNLISPNDYITAIVISINDSAAAIASFLEKMCGYTCVGIIRGRVIFRNADGVLSKFSQQRSVGLDSAPNPWQYVEAYQDEGVIQHHFMVGPVSDEPLLSYLGFRTSRTHSRFSFEMGKNYYTSVWL